jgi:hypothetical protein
VGRWQVRCRSRCDVARPREGIWPGEGGCQATWVRGQLSLPRERGADHGKACRARRRSSRSRRSDRATGRRGGFRPRASLPDASEAVGDRRRPPVELAADDGKALRLWSTLRFLDGDGTELYKIQSKVARVRDTMEIERAGGGFAAKVHNALLTPLARSLVDRRTRRAGSVGGGQQPGPRVPHRARTPARGHGVEGLVPDTRLLRCRVAAGEDVALMLAIAVVIDMMGHDGR